jgi:hypothetical protein
MFDSLKINRGISINGYDYEGGLYLNPKSAVRVDAAKQAKDYMVALASATTNLAPDPRDNEQLAKDKAEALNTVRKALDGDKDALRSLNAIRLTQVDNFVKANSNFLSFFEVVTLRDDEESAIFNTTQNEIAVGYLAQDGKPQRVKVTVEEAQTRIPLRFLSTKKVNYRTHDIYRGNIAPLATKTFDLAAEMANKIDRHCLTLLTSALGSGGAFGAFTTTGSKPSRVYVPHSNIVTSHLPTTNDITVYNNAISADGATYNDPASSKVGRFSPRVLQEIIRYADSWGNLFSWGRIVPTGEIIVPSSDIFAIFADLTVVSTNASRPSETDVERQIRENGYTSLPFGGINWRFVPDVTIASGTCYPRFNMLPGQVFFKPGMDAEFVDTDREQNTEARSQRKVMGAYIIDQWRPRIARFTYK